MIITLAFIVLTAPLASAEIIHLKDGRKLEGKVVKVDVKLLTFKYKIGTISSVLTFAWSEIDKVTTPKGCTIEGLNEMEHKGLSSSLIQGMVTSFNKINSIKTDQL